MTQETQNANRRIVGGIGGSITGSGSGNAISNGTIAEVGGRTCIYFDGYWIKYYEPPPESLEAKKALIEALTRRLFNHVEHGINIPGIRLDEARAAYEAETDPDRKRVNGAMLAGALFNRAASIFTKLYKEEAYPLFWGCVQG